MWRDKIYWFLFFRVPVVHGFLTIKSFEESLPKLLSGPLARFWEWRVLKRASDVLGNDVKANFQENIHVKVQFQRRSKDHGPISPPSLGLWQNKRTSCQFCWASLRWGLNRINVQVVNSAAVYYLGKFSMVSFMPCWVYCNFFTVNQ